jgi:hypothetical protein
MFTVIGTGSRNLINAIKVHEEFEFLRSMYGEILVREGECPEGADSFIKTWCEFYGPWNGVFLDPHPADWDNCSPDCPPGHRKLKAPGDTVHPGLLSDYCPKAGPRRNKEMAALGAELCLAFPLGKSYGTWNCVNECKKAGIPVKVLE